MEANGTFLHYNSSASGNARQHNGNVYNSNTHTYNLPSSAAGSNPLAQILSTQGTPTPLHKAVARGDEDLVRSLVLDQGANIEAQNDDWMTPLQLAVLKNNTSIARILLDAGANVEARCKMWSKSQPPLFLAVNAGNEGNG
jgi:ankyrin repeat protein